MSVDPNWKWREGAEALTKLGTVASELHLTEDCIAGYLSELRTAIRQAREAGVPEEGIEHITGLDHTEVDRIAGTPDQPDPDFELANAKVHALASIEHLRRELAYNKPPSIIRELRKQADTAVVAYTRAQDKATHNAR